MPVGIYQHKKSQGFQKGNVTKTQFRKGHKNYLLSHTVKTKERLRAVNLGKKASEATKKKLSILFKGKPNAKISEALKGKKLSLNTRRKISESHRGEKAYNWQGGITRITLQIRGCFEYRQWRSDIFTRDEFICQKCGVKGGKLNAHHKKEFSKIIRENDIKTLEEALSCDELWNINNGITLCDKCHKQIKCWVSEKSNNRSVNM